MIGEIFGLGEKEKMGLRITKCPAEKHAAG
jgi:hypothetical protein